MKRVFSVGAAVLLALAALAPAARAAVNVERKGSENPMVEVAKSTVYGGLAGLMVGGAIAWASESSENDGEVVRWSFVGGTFLGLGFGIYHVATRPEATALLEFRGGAPKLHAALPVSATPRGGRLNLVTVRF